MPGESGNRIGDIVFAQLVECQPEPAAQVKTDLPSPPEASPVAHSRDATIEQTGAGPPPEGA